MINWLPYVDGYIFNYTQPLNNNTVLIELTEQYINDTIVKPLSVEIYNIYSPNSVVVNISGRIIPIPPYSSAVLKIPKKAPYIKFSGVSSVDVTFYSMPNDENIMYFNIPNIPVTTNDYFEMPIYFDARNISSIKYSAGAIFPFNGAVGDDIKTPIKIANADNFRLKTILSNNLNMAANGIFLFYGFSQDTCTIPFQDGISIVNAPMSTAEYWIKFYYDANTTSNPGASIYYGSIIKEFYGHN